MLKGDTMLVEAYVRNKVNEYTMDCIVAINKYFTREQQYILFPLNKKKDNFSIDDILHRGIYIWKNPFFLYNNHYVGKIIYRNEDRIVVVNQSFQEILKKIE
jgi:hypothetical protein